MSDVSVVVTSYNESEYIAEAIDSILAQTVRPKEVLILDDASSDGTQDIIREYSEQHSELIDPHFHDENIGIARNRNYGLRNVNGDYVTFLDGDNKFLPRKIETERAEMNASGIGLAFSDFYYTNSDGTVINQWCGESNPPTGDVYEQTLTREWPSRTLFSHPMVDSSIYKKSGGYDEALAYYEDWDLFIRLTKHTEIAYTGIPLVEYRQHWDSLSHRMTATDALTSYQHILKKYTGRGAETPSQRKIHGMLDKRRGEVYYEQGHRVAAISSLLKVILHYPSLVTKGDIKYIIPKFLFLTWKHI